MSFESQTTLTTESSTSTSAGQPAESNGRSTSTEAKRPTRSRRQPEPKEDTHTTNGQSTTLPTQDGSSPLKDDSPATVEMPAEEPTPSVGNNGSATDGQLAAAPPASDQSPEQVDESQPTKGKPEKFAIELTAAKFIELLLEKAKVKFFHDQHGNCFAWVPTVEHDFHYECLATGSKAFRARLVQLAEAFATKATPASVINEVIQAGELLAFRERRRDMANRHRSDNGRIAIDLGDSGWQMLMVSREGWNLCSQSEGMFFRPQHMKNLPEPVAGGDPFELFEYVTAESDEDRLLILSWTVSAMIPEVPSPILNFTGGQGSAKTTRSKRLRDLTDPSVTPVLGDMELSNLFLTFQHHAVPSFENVSKFDRRTADMFCRAVTGNGVERRKLFTNSDQVLYSFRRPIIINGIDTPSTRPDFLDRCIVINCERVKSFRPLKELDEAFEAARPRLFGALLDLLVKTLNVLPKTEPSGEFRMADFAHFGRAIAVALGKTPEDFDNAYRSNIRGLNKEALDATPLTIAVKAFAKKHPEAKAWTGSAQELLAELRGAAKVLGDPTISSDLPKSARWLSSRLGELATALAAEGITVDRLPRTSSQRGWKVYITDEANEERRSAMTPQQISNEEYDHTDLIDDLHVPDEDSPE